MKIGIVTLHNAFNYGAFLQAYATQKKLGELGHQATILHFENTAGRRARYRTLMSRRPATLAFNILKFAAFRDAWRHLSFADVPYDRSDPGYDVIVLGSDEIWNVRNSTFVALPQYFGRGLRAGRLVAYAPSASESSLADLRERPEAIAGITGIQHLSVRDQQTQDVVLAATGREATLVLDPTFLVDYEHECRRSNRQGFVLVYTYGFGAERIAAVTAFARRRNLQLLSVGFNNPWCDSSIAATPFEFLGLIQAADCVVTDTYHGTIFSILFRKPFGSFTAKKMKVSYLLSSLGLSGRGIDVSRSLEEVMAAGVDYGAVDIATDRLKAQSLSFLERSLAS